ncbi:MAG: hypothetical protein NXI20_03585 [bacterium]|nr:hypothetical protein [bacterium]
MVLVNSLCLWVALNISGWELFENTRFKWEWSDEYETKIEIPIFDQALLKQDGTTITLTGYYIPMEIEGSTIVISKNTFASCFFCGGAGPETVAEIELRSKHRGLKADQLVSVKGKLKLNKYDYEHLVFMLVDAEIIEK